MGVVWEAWDERLERRVAIKQVRPEVAGDERLRARFRREARMAARLMHPAIVQIFDVVESDDGDWLVMELAEGQSLAELAAGDALAIDAVLRLAKDVARGLAEAHAHGLVHRDLKAENVLVSPAGRAKVLDFGLAKPFDEPQTEDSLTNIGQVVGTVRAMSPEQAAGLPVDPRSDLFAFGVLLYEMVTGTSPFGSASRAETLKRIYSYQPPPVNERDPRVPVRLSRLIDRLLDKDPAQRPTSAHEVADEVAAIAARGYQATDPELDQATWAAGRPPSQPTTRTTGRGGWSPMSKVLVLGISVLAAGLLAAALWIAWPRPAPLVVAVAPVSPSDPAVPSLIPPAIETALVRGLVALEGVVTLVPERRGAEGSSLAAALRDSAADELVTSRVSCSAETAGCTITLMRLAAPDGRVVWSESSPAPRDDLELAATAVLALIERGFADRFVSKATGLGADSQRIGRFLALRQSYEARSEDLDTEHLMAELLTLRDEAPAFLEVYLLAASIAKDRFYDTRDEAFLERAFALLRDAGELAPEDPRPLLELASVAISGEQQEVADRAIESFRALAPADPRGLQLAALLAERRGSSDDAHRLMLQAVAQLPSRRHRLQLANLEIRIGRVAAARETLADLRQRSPNDVDALALLAQIELLYGEPAAAVPLYEELMVRAPTAGERTNLGIALMLTGRFDGAVEAFRQAHESVPANASIVLNLADAELLSGRRDRAMELYGRVLELVAQDAAAETFWQNLTTRAQALAHLGQLEDAVEAVIEAGRLAPDNPQVSYETAVVYALVGDRASAAVHARAARDAGVDARWFRFPWFDTVRTELMPRQES